MTTLPLIQQIKIMLDTNIPDKEPFALTSSMLFHPSVKQMPKLAEHLFITMNYEYNFSLINFLNKQPYDQKLKFFFNKDYQSKLLIRYGIYKQNVKIIKDINKKNKDHEKKIFLKEKNELTAEIRNLITKIENKKTTEINKFNKNYPTEEDKKKIENINKIFNCLKQSVYSGDITVINNQYTINLSDKQKCDPNLFQIYNKGFDPKYTDNNKARYNNPIEQLNILLKKNKENKKIEEKQNDISKKNLMTFFRIVFPTSFPVFNNISDSFDIIGGSSNDFTLQNAIPHFLRLNTYPSQYYSYLKLDGKIYTNTQLIWLNDVYNHPIYADLISKYNQFNIQVNSSKEKLEIELTKKKEKFEKDFKKDGNNAIDESIIDFFKNESNNITGDRNYSESTKKQTFKEIINNIESLITNLNSDIVKYEIILPISNNIKNQYETIEKFNVSIDITIKNKISKFTDSVSKINTLETIFSKYLDSNEIVLNYKNDSETIINELKEKYDFYMTFVDSIKEYTRPKRESLNIILQEKIEDFANGTHNENEETIFEILNDKENNDILKYIRSDFCKLRSNDKEPSLEIYVQLNVIEGELNDSNKSKINCIYKSDFLGNTLEQLLYPQQTKWMLNKKRIFFNINDKEVQKEIKEKEANAILSKPIDSANNPSPIVGPSIPVQGGTRHKTFKKLPIYKLRKSIRRRFIF